MLRWQAYISCHFGHNESQCLVWVPTIIPCLRKLERMDIYLNRLQWCRLDHLCNSSQVTEWALWQLCPYSVNGLSNCNCALIDFLSVSCETLRRIALSRLRTLYFSLWPLQLYVEYCKDMAKWFVFIDRRCKTHYSPVPESICSRHFFFFFLCCNSCLFVDSKTTVEISVMVQKDLIFMWTINILLISYTPYLQEDTFKLIFYMNQYW